MRIYCRVPRNRSNMAVVLFSPNWASTWNGLRPLLFSASALILCNQVRSYLNTGITQNSTDLNCFLHTGTARQNILYASHLLWIWCHKTYAIRHRNILCSVGRIKRYKIQIRAIFEGIFLTFFLWKVVYFSWNRLYKSPWKSLSTNSVPTCSKASNL